MPTPAPISAAIRLACACKVRASIPRKNGASFAGIILAGCLLLIGCDKPAITGISCTIDEGIGLVSDEVYFTNTTGKNLTDVTITMTVTGINGTQKSQSRFWAVWNLGERKEISMSAFNGETVKLIQGIQLTGKANEGNISVYWRYNNSQSN